MAVYGNGMARLAPEYVADHSLHELVPHPDNARRGNVAMIAESLRTHGQFKNLVVQRASDNGTKLVVCAGNHTLAAMRSLSWEQGAVLLVDVDDEEAARILLIDNRSNDVADYDDRALAELLAALSESDRGLLGTGYEDRDLADLLDMLNTPSLMELAAEHGDHDPESTWPVLRFKVSPDTRARYMALTAHCSGSDADLFTLLLTWAERGRPL